jgi:hypothetical protein
MIPKWGTAAILVAPPAPLLSTGFVAGNTLPAQFWNYMWFHMTAELLNVLAAGGVAQNAAVDNQLATAIGLLVTSLSSGSPYTVPLNSGVYFILATTNPYVMNLPASSGSGVKIRIVDLSALATGLVQIVPHGTDNIGAAGNVSVYLQNVDQSGFVYKYQWIELTDTVSGTWDVTGGQFCPAQAVDANGQQYHLGKLHHLPLGNTTSRLLFSNHPPNSGNYSSPITATGVFGVPVGAKAIRCKGYINPHSLAAAGCQLAVAFSDNNSNTPSGTTGNPEFQVLFTATAASQTSITYSEIDIPLNASGQFYMYTYIVVNTTPASDFIELNVVGYYMGD